MSDVAVVTANFGGYDVPRGAVAQEGYEDADWWYVGSPEWCDGDPNVPPPWWLTRYALDGDTDASSRLLAKRFKLTPWEFWPAYRWIVWIDANMEITSPFFLNEALASASCAGAPVTAWRHPRRTSAFDEAAASLTEAPAKYGAMAHGLGAQVDVYRAMGFPDDLGLWACGTLVWNMDHDKTPILGERWLAECERCTVQDQVSFPFACWASGVEAGTFPVDQVPRFQSKSRSAPYIQNEWLRIWPHNRED